MEGTREKNATAAENRVEALRHPLRAKILRLLIKGGPNTPSQMARELDAKLDDVAYHTERLAKLGCAEHIGERRTRAKGPPAHLYRATERYLIKTQEWGDLSPVEQDHLVIEFIEAHFDDLDLGVRSGTLGADENFHLTQTRILADEQGRDELLELWETTRKTALEIQDRSAKRLLALGTEPINISTLLGCFEVPLAEESPAQEP